MRIFTAIICIAVIVFASPAFAYKRDVPSKKVTTEESQAGEPVQKGDEEAAEEVQETIEEDYSYQPRGSGLVTTGYIFIGLGSAAAIAGSTIITATDKNITGAIISGGGAALALAGSMMILFGSREGYAVAPVVDPKSGTYGIAAAANF